MSKAASPPERKNSFDLETNEKHFSPEGSFYIRLRLAETKPPTQQTVLDACQYSDMVFGRALKILEIVTTRSSGSISGYPVGGVPAVVLNGPEADIIAVLSSPELRGSIEGIYPSPLVDVTA